MKYLECSVKSCLYNDAGGCQARGVSIKIKNEAPVCETYVDKEN